MIAVGGLATIMLCNLNRALIVFFGLAEAASGSWAKEGRRWLGFTRAVDTRRVRITSSL